MELVKRIVRWVLPESVHGRLRARWRANRLAPPPGRLRLGSLRRLTPISRQFGFDRGLPIDRYYIERFLDAHAADIQGRVLEIKDNTYTRRFGGSRVTESDVLDVAEGNPQATIVGDLSYADHIPSDSFDCVILTQTLHLIYDVRAALQTLHRILRPGGVLLVTVPGISQIARDDTGGWSDCWRFTTLSARRLLEEEFSGGDVVVESNGNVLVSVAFLHGLATEELSPEELDHQDLDYQTLITARAVRN